MRLIDADKLKTSLNETVDAAIKWHEDCLGEIACGTAHGWNWLLDILTKGRRSNED